MKKRLILAALGCFYAAQAGNAQEVTGAPGSPAATTPITGKQLPAPDPKFGGVIQDEALKSKPWWAPRIVPSKEAPNVLLIITDDSGFGVPSPFGGVIPTPAMDRLAKNGLRYNNLHSTALCSPTRAALMILQRDEAFDIGSNTKSNPHVKPAGCLLGDGPRFQPRTNQPCQEMKIPLFRNE